MRHEGLWKRIAVILLAILMIYALIEPPWPEEMEPAVTTEDVAVGVFDDYGFTFMILGVLLAAAMIGGIFMAKMPRELGRHVRKGKIVERRMKGRPPTIGPGGAC